MNSASCKAATIALFATLALLPAARPDEPGGWSLLLEDKFDRLMMGGNWRALRGHWEIKDRRLQAISSCRTNQCWQGDYAAILCTLPLRYDSVRVECDVTAPKKHNLTVNLRSGGVLWGTGGVNDQFGASIGMVHGNREWFELARSLPFLDAPVHPVDAKPHRVVIQIDDGQGRVQLDGKTVQSGRLPLARSDLNCFLTVSTLSEGSVGNLKIFTRTTKGPRAERTFDNRRATVEVTTLIDPANPALEIQKAIDSLPPSGGVVLLPEGEFVMRRHLQLRSNVTLRGQGPKTLLKASPVVASRVTSRESTGGVHRVTVENALAFKVGDAISFRKSWGHPGSVRSENRGVLITAIDGNRLTLTEAPPADAASVYHWFPLINAEFGEWVEVKDLKLAGDLNTPTDVNGSFQTTPVNLAMVYGARVSRVAVDGWKGDGILVADSADSLVTDNTVTRVAQGMHFGGFTERLVCARNRNVGNSVNGIFFCWNNQNGVYFENTLDSIHGYPDIGDVCNTLGHVD